MDKQEAERLWDEFRGALMHGERVLKDIIDNRAWEPMGYDSFVECYMDRMAGVRLATDAVKAEVIYALFDSGLDDEATTTVLGPGSGVGPVALAQLREQRAQGIPADLATIRVRSHLRKATNSGHRIIHVELTPTEVYDYTMLAERANSSLKIESEKAIRNHFTKLTR